MIYDSIEREFMRIYENRGNAMTELSRCPECHSEYTYEDRNLIVCSMCGHEWTLDVVKESIEEESTEEVIKDSNGNILDEGDDIVVIKDLKVSGSSSIVKRGAKAKNIQLIYNASDGHDINCKVEGFGAIKLKSEFVKKA